MSVQMKSSVLIGLLLLWPSALWGQGGRAIAREARAPEHVRQECRRAAAALLAGPSAEQAWKSVRDLYFCDLSAPPALVAAWRNPVIQSEALSMLASVSQRNHDRRILEAVLPIVRDEGEGFDRRLAAVTVLGSYLVPSLQISPSEWYASPEQEWPAQIGLFTHATWAIGPEPLDADAPERIAAVLNGVLDTSEDIRLSRAIEQVLRIWERRRAREGRSAPVPGR